MPKSLHDLMDVLASKHTTMVTQLHHFCNINSGSYHLNGLEQMRQTLHAAFLPIADHIEVIESLPINTIDMSGNNVLLATGHSLFIQKRPHLKRRVLLSGHMDTVYSQHHPFQQLTYLNDNILKGPGVADMKGGLIVILHALAAFEKTPFAQELGWDVVINADEEIGSLASAPFLEKIAKRYQAALVYEPAMDAEGTLAKNRKGSGKFTVIAHGKAAHAGRAFEEGRNAICHLAQAILAIDALNSQREGVTINVGKIAGGSALNVVADTAVAKLDIRILKPDDEKWVSHQLEHIINTLSHQELSLTLHGHFGRPVKQVNEATKHLFKRLQTIGKELGLTLNWQNSGGCCDGNNLSRHHLPVIDTLGVRGGNIHSPEEYIVLDSLVERATLSALLLVDLAQGGLEALKK